MYQKGVSTYHFPLIRRLKRFNLKVVVNLGEAIVKLEIFIYILGLYIDRKLK